MGFVGAFAYRGQFVGTIRFMPMEPGLAPCENILRGHRSPCRYPNSWEVGRLVLAPQYRGGPEALKRCLFLSLLSLIRTREADHLFASCTPILGRLYRRFGFSVVAKDACHDTAGSFSLIHGPVPMVLQALATSAGEKALAETEIGEAEAV